MLHISPTRLAALAAQGGIPCEFTPGGHRRYRRSVIDSLVCAAEMKAVEENGETPDWTDSDEAKFFGTER